MANFRNRSAISFLIILFGIFLLSIATYSSLESLMNPVRYKHIDLADYEFWFDNNSLASTGQIEANLTPYSSYSFVEGYDREGVETSSGGLRVSDGGRYSSITATLFVYLDGDEVTVLNLRQRANTYFHVYTKGAQICFESSYYGTTYSDCFSGLDLNEWYAVGIRWGSGYDVEFYLNDPKNVKYVPYDGSSLRVNSIRLGGRVDEVKIYWDYLSDSYFSQSLKFIDYPISKNAYEWVSSIYLIIFATTMILLLGVLKAIKRPVEYYAPVYVLAILEMLASMFLLIVILSVVTGTDIIGFLHFVQADGYSDYIIQFAALLVLVIHLAMVYEATIRT